MTTHRVELPLVKAYDPRANINFAQQSGARQQRDADLVVLRRYVEKAERLVTLLRMVEADRIAGWSKWEIAEDILHHSVIALAEWKKGAT